MKLSALSALFFSLALVAGGAAKAADPVSFATTAAGTSTYNVVLAIAKAASTQSNLDIRLRSFKSTTQGLAPVDSGEVGFGLESALAITQAYNGTGPFESGALKNLRLVATIFPYRASLVVRDSDPAKTIADIAGKRFPSGFRSSPSLDALSQALLATAGLTYKDMATTDVSVLADAQDAFVAGSLDAVVGVTNSAALTQMDQNAGPLRFLSVGTDADAATRARKFIPNARIVVVEPDPSIPLLRVATPMLEYDYFVYASTQTPDDVVVGVIDALLKGGQDLVQISPGFAWFDHAKIAQDIGVPYHPAAEAHLKELGLWPTP